MIRRQAISPDESLELLLDTICNTFGAVIFISMMASVLVQNGAASTSMTAQITASQQALQVQESRLSDLQQRRSALEIQLAAQQELIDRFSSSASLSLAQQIHDDKHARVDLAAKKAEAVDDRVETEKQRMALEQRLARQLEELARARDDQATAAELLQSLSEKVGHTAEIRRVHETHKASFVLALDNGRLYAVHDAGSDGAFRSLTINRDDCDVSDESGSTIVQPLPSAGLLIRGNANAKTEAESKLRGVNQQFVFTLFVARDSFGEFLPVKEAIRSLGFEYALEIMDGDDVALQLTEDSQRKSFVQ